MEKKRNTFLSNPKYTNEKGLAHKNKYLKVAESNRQDEKVCTGNTPKWICLYRSMQVKDQAKKKGSKLKYKAGKITEAIRYFLPAEKL